MVLSSEKESSCQITVKLFGFGLLYLQTLLQDLLNLVLGDVLMNSTELSYLSSL